MNLYEYPQRHQVLFLLRNVPVCSVCKVGLEVQASHYTITAHRLVVLAEVNTVSQDWGNLFFKLPLAEAFEEVAARVTEETWLNNENAFNICFDDIHLLYFKKGRLHTKSRKVAYKISPRHFACRNYFLLKIPNSFLMFALSMSRQADILAYFGVTSLILWK